MVEILAAVFAVLLWAIVIVDVVGAGYLLVLTLAAVLPSSRRSPAASQALRFAFVIPAHNEEEMLGQTLESIRGLEYDLDQYSVHVVADNCFDDTAAVARSFGAMVHERNDPENPGKGQALEWFLKTVASREDFDAAVFIDADTVIAPDFLQVAAEYLNSGHEVLQSSYRVRDPEKSPVVGLRALAFSLFHDLRGRGKARLGLSSGLWGNGMVFRRKTLFSMPWESFSAVEDAEQYLRLLLKGVRVGFMGETSVSGHMPASLNGAKEQQRRWEAGRMGLTRQFFRLLIPEAVRARRPALALAFLDMAIPPLSVHFLATIVVVGTTVGMGQTAQTILSAGCVGALLTYVLVGLARAHVPARTYLALWYAPTYILWKLSLYAIEFIRRRNPDWVRTVRDGQTSTP
jgi:cellulose synthase/poly-beta-1,6-N-acetylglucosamine synthase-like glycosyltransferase